MPAAALPPQSAPGHRQQPEPPEAQRKDRLPLWAATAAKECPGCAAPLQSASSANAVHAIALQDCLACLDSLASTLPHPGRYFQTEFNCPGNRTGHTQRDASKWRPGASKITEEAHPRGCNLTQPGSPLCAHGDNTIALFKASNPALGQNTFSNLAAQPGSLI